MIYRMFSLLAVFALQAQAEPALLLDSLTGQIELRDGEPPVTELLLTLSNASDQTITPQLGFTGAEATSISVEPGATASVSLQPLISYEGHAGSLQTVVIDLSLALPNNTSTSISTTDISLLLPESAYPVVKSDPQLMDNTAQLDGVHYEYYKENRASSPLTVVYNPGPVNLSMRKTLYPIPVVTGPVTVTIDITNFGEQTAEGLVLTDHLNPEEFSAEGDAFTQTATDGGAEDLLLWQAEIDSLGAGETTRVSYQVNALGDIGDTELPVTEATIGGRLIGYSNKVWLPKWH